MDGERQREKGGERGREGGEKGLAGEVKVKEQEQEEEHVQEALRGQALTLSVQSRPRDPITQSHPQNQMGPSRPDGWTYAEISLQGLLHGSGDEGFTPSLASTEWKSAPGTSLPQPHLCSVGPWLSGPPFSGPGRGET